MLVAGMVGKLQNPSNQRRPRAAYYPPYVRTPLSIMNLYNTSKLKIFNKNYKGLGTTEKEKKQEETQTGR